MVVVGVVGGNTDLGSSRMEAAVAHLVGGRAAAAGVEDTAILAPMPTLHLDVVAAFLFLSPYFFPSSRLEGRSSYPLAPKDLRRS